MHFWHSVAVGTGASEDPRGEFTFLDRVVSVDATVNLGENFL